MDRIEEKIISIIEKNADRIIAFGDDIWHHAELGYQEYRTSQKFSAALEEIGLRCEKGLAVTGVRSFLKEPGEGDICVALMGEMDALPFSNHVDANPETGAAHCCGHDAQLTGVFGAAIALSDPEIAEALGGNICFYGVPSEEAATAPEHKKQLMAEGKIAYQGGKIELIRQGYMDGIDITVGHHICGGDPEGKTYLVQNAPSLGCMDKFVTYYGLQQHAVNVHRGVDAQCAAALAMHAVDAQRDGLSTFTRNSPYLLHGYILSGGSASNIVSDKVQMDFSIRAMTPAMLRDISYRTDRALRGAAVATGAGMESETQHVYLPVRPVKDASVVTEMFEMINDGTNRIRVSGADDMGGCTDYGDLSNVMPVFQFWTGGQHGSTHSVDFCVNDPREYYLTPAKGFAIMAYKLLKNNAARAKKVLEENGSYLSKEEYLEVIGKMGSREKTDMVPAPEFR